MSMLKDYLSEHKTSMYKLAAESGVPYSTVNDLANGRIEIEQCRAGILKRLSDTLAVTMDDLYNLCDNELRVYSEEWKTDVKIRVKNKTYYAEFDDHGTPVLLEVCPVNKDTRYFIRSLAKWTAEDYFERLEWETMNAILAHA